MAVELVGIELNLRGADEVYNDLQRLDNMLDSLGGRKQVQLGLAKAKEEIIATRGEIQKLERDIDELMAGRKRKEIIDPDEIERLEDLEQQLKEARNAMQDFQQAARETRYALQNLAPATFMQNFKKASSSIAHVGSALQSAGNALTRFSMPFRSLMSGAVLGAGYKMLNKVSEGLTSGFTRWDTMNKYKRLMAEYSTETYNAEQSIQDLDKSVTGLPIALDDAVSLAQRYTLSLGDMERGTKLAIATNNAFLASMATENQRYQGMLQMQDLLNGKKLNSREWMSLGASMGKAINEIGKEFGYTNENMGEFRQELYAGKISTKDFLDALEKVGTGEGSLVKLAEESKNTWEAFFSRIGTAFSRMGLGVLEGLDEVVNIMTKGKFKNLNSWLDDYVINGIDNMTASVKNWIKANPEKISDFFHTLTTINWRGFVEGIAQGSMALANLVTSLGQLAGGKGMTTIGKFMVYSGLVGRGLTIMGGLLKGTRHLWGGLYAGAKELKKGGIGGLLKSIMFGTGAGSSGEKALETVADAAPKMGKVMGGLNKVFVGWAEVATMIGGSALVGVGSVKALKTIIKDLGEVGELVKTVDWESATAALENFAAYIIGMGMLGAAIGKSGMGLKVLEGGAILSGLTAMFAGTFWADMEMIKRGVKALNDTGKYLNEAVDNLNNIKTINEVGGVKTRIKNAITTFNQIIDLLTGEKAERNTPVFGEGREGGLKNLSQSVVKSMEGVSSSISAIKTTIETLNEIGESEINIVDFRRKLVRFEYAMGLIGQMLTELPEGLGTELVSENTNRMKDIVGNVRDAFDGLVGENGILNQIPQILSAMEGITRHHGISMLKTNMQELGEAFKSIYDSLSLEEIGNPLYLSNNMNNLREAMKQVRLALHHFNELGNVEISGSVVENVSGAIAKIKEAFSDREVNQVWEAVGTFRDSIKDALDSFKDLNGDIEIKAKVKLSSGFDRSVTETTSKIKKAGVSIDMAMGMIPTTINKTIDVNIDANVNTSGFVSAIRGAASVVTNIPNNGGSQISWGRGGRSGGGLIYRAKGGSVFKPRGTDTVPAMLTVGEFVQNKHATEFWGLDFMRKINSMDVRGAMDALMTKAGRATGFGRQNIYNHTVNNNQRVNMTVNTNNPNFAGARMGRFVGAL